MASGALVSENMTKKISLIDLDAILVALKDAVLGCDLASRRCETGKCIRCGIYELLDPYKAGKTICQICVHSFYVAAQKSFTRHGAASSSRALTIS